MSGTGDVGQIVILNGAPRSGKSSIVEVIQETFEGPWMNLGVDIFCRLVTPPRYQPGMGLRPGGERPDLEDLIPSLYAALYDSIAAHSRHGLNVVVDVGHHDAYSRPLRVLRDSARRLDGLAVLFVGVRCPLDVILQRRGLGDSDDPVPDPIQRWQREVHVPGVYDLEVDTSTMTPEECAATIRDRLAEGPRPEAFRRLASGE